MTNQEKQELNEKLARWAGFTKCHSHHCGYWFYPEGSSAQGTGFLEFTDSLDACFKWLVPKIETFHGFGRKVQVKLVSGWGDTVGDYGAEVIEQGKRLALEFNQDPALALCLAIERLI